MGHGKETPRQKMIGMMYLVLTALLALNVSKDVLDAFILIDDGLMKTTLNFDKKNQTSYDIFDAQMDKSAAKVEPFRDIAHEVKRRADQLAFDIQELKVDLVRHVDGKEAPALKKVDENGKATKEDNVLHWQVGIGESMTMEETLYITGINIQTKDNMDKPTQMFSTESGGMGKGDVLQNKMDEFRDFLLYNVFKADTLLRVVRTADGNIAKSPDAENIETIINNMFNTGDKSKKEAPVADSKWIIDNFKHLPMVAVATNLTKMQSDVRYIEAEVIQYLLNKIDAGDTKVNKMEAVVLTKSNYVLRGGQFEARVLLAAYDSLQKPEIWLGRYRKTDNDYEMDGGTLLPYDNKGRAMIVRQGGSVGSFSVEGLLRLETSEGLRSFPFSTEYQVGEQSTVISATRMNVLYTEVDNPVQISMSGVPSEAIRVTMTNGTITKSGNEWIARPNTPGAAKIMVSATVEGKPLAGDMDFRVFRVPTPLAKVGNLEPGPVAKNILASQQGVLAFMDNFVFDLRYQVIGFTMRIGSGSPMTSTSAALTAEQKTALNGTIPRGTPVVFSDIRARITGSGGGARNLQDIVFTIQ